MGSFRKVHHSEYYSIYKKARGEATQAVGFVEPPDVIERREMDEWQSSLAQARRKKKNAVAEEKQEKKAKTCGPSMQQIVRLENVSLFGVVAVWHLV